ncbi:hypothetical protein JTB14_014646 [Gonioctena quinquepunctata]|nr:hypothetical protein JTB14_014646 [Gonioctena quinquepunctata]
MHKTIALLAILGVAFAVPLQDPLEGAGKVIADEAGDVARTVIEIIGKFDEGVEKVAERGVGNGTNLIMIADTGDGGRVAVNGVKGSFEVSVKNVTVKRLEAE